MARKEKGDRDDMTMGDIERALIRLAKRVDEPNGLEVEKANCLRAIYQAVAEIKREERKSWWQSRVGVLWEERQRQQQGEGEPLDS